MPVFPNNLLNNFTNQKTLWGKKARLLRLKTNN